MSHPPEGRSDEPGGEPRSVDEQFADIVRNFGNDVPHPFEQQMKDGEDEEDRNESGSPPEPGGQSRLFPDEASAINPAPDAAPPSPPRQETGNQASNYPATGNDTPGRPDTANPNTADTDAADTDAATDWRSWSADDDDEGHFEPPTPDLPAGDLHLWGIIAGLIGGPVLLLLVHGVGVLDGALWTWVGLALCVTGAVMLWLRLPTQRDDDPTGGAQV